MEIFPFASLIETFNSLIVPSRRRLNSGHSMRTVLMSPKACHPSPMQARSVEGAPLAIFPDVFLRDGPTAFAASQSLKGDRPYTHRRRARLRLGRRPGREALAGHRIEGFPTRGRLLVLSTRSLHRPLACGWPP